MKLRISSKYTILLIILLAAAGLKAGLMISQVVPFNSDEAVVALMARHILQGERPVFFYGQAYMGSLDAFLVALGFLVFGEHIWVIRLVQAVLYLVTLLTVVAIGKWGFGSTRTGLIAAALLAVPPVNVTLYTTASLGGYGEALLIGNIILLCTIWISKLMNSLRVDRNGQASLGIRKNLYWVAALWGLLVGLGLWAFGLTLIYSIPCGIYLVWQLSKSQAPEKDFTLLRLVFAAAAGFFVGSLPWWIYAAQNGFTHLIYELTGSAVMVDPAPYLVQTFNHLVYFVLLGLPVLWGFRPPWEVQWLALPLLPFVLIFWCAIVYDIFRRLMSDRTTPPVVFLLIGLALINAIAFICTPFGVDPSGRYFLPLTIVMAFLAANFLTTRRLKLGKWVWGLLALVLVYQGAGTLQTALQYPPGLTTQFNRVTLVDRRYDADLIDFLATSGEMKGFTNYWVAYPLAFQTQEKAIFVPTLPYHDDLRYTPRDDRYLPYHNFVDTQEKVAFITTRHQVLDDFLREGFRELGVSWQEKQIGDYRVFYSLTRRVIPEDLGLGMAGE
jgi:4-amino-4-deoxy-L-arabinose transferase-like glycosyltransferase